MKVAKIFQRSKYMRYSLLTFLILILFSLIAAAQEPRPSGGANGQERSPKASLPKPILIGNRMTEEFWTKEHLIYDKQDTLRKSLAEYKGKVIIFDFWATWCGACFQTMPKMQALQDAYGDNFQVILVNPIVYDKDYTKLTHAYDKFQRKSGVSLPSIVLDEYLVGCFPHLGIPRYIWINQDGDFIAATRNSFVYKDQLAKVLTGEF